MSGVKKRLWQRCRREPLSQKVRTVAGKYASQLLSYAISTGGSTPILRRPYGELAKWYYRYQKRDIDEYRALLDPFKIVWVDPERITYMTGRTCPWEDVRANLGAVRAGDWDRQQPPDLDTGHPARPNWHLYKTRAFEDNIRHQSFVAHFRDNVPWKETEFIRKVRWMVDYGPIWMCTTEREVEERCSYYDDLYATITSYGYKSQWELICSGRQSWPGLLSALTDEILVDVGRDGELLFADGRHRLSIAMILGLDEIPIVFQIRSPRWMEHRDTVYESGSPSTHPDLRDIVPLDH